MTFEGEKALRSHVNQLAEKNVQEIHSLIPWSSTKGFGSMVGGVATTGRNIRDEMFSVRNDLDIQLLSTSRSRGRWALRKPLSLSKSFPEYESVRFRLGALEACKAASTAAKENQRLDTHILDIRTIHEYVRTWCLPSLFSEIPNVFYVMNDRLVSLHEVRLGFLVFVHRLE